MRKNETKEILFEESDVDVKINYVWDTKRGYVNWNKQVSAIHSAKAAHVKLENYKFTEVFESTGISQDFEVNQLIVNSIKIPGDTVDSRGKVNSKTGRMSITFKVVVGWG